MKKIALMFALIGTYGFIGSNSTAWAQGSLNPPGAPAPIMKTLNQIEARTAITNVPYTITNSGSYYLTGNFTGIAGTDGITIDLDNVTLDLNGFTLTGVPGSLAGILVPSSRNNVSIFNGILRAWGTYGVQAGGT
ncbi:MAG: hypothetical protein GKR87_03885 [Kiritimatiellae bacterium]|nr:hypothetical protein [Kiritimatiellia bacterium]